MRISYTSDLHLEHSSIILENTNNSDVLILAGDICMAAKLFAREESILGISERFHSFFNRCSKEFKHIIYVGGNHEAYLDNIQGSMTHIKECLGYIKNLHILDNKSIEIDDVTFVGSTLWADANNSDPSSMVFMKRVMSDFRVIRNGKLAFSPDDMVEAFNKNIAFINNATKNTSKQYAVVTHHGVSERCVAEQYKNEYFVNGAFRSRLDQFIRDRPQIKSWVSGHTHHAYDFEIGDTRVMCNPRGYPNEIKIPFELKTFDLK